MYIIIYSHFIQFDGVIRMYGSPFFFPCDCVHCVLFGTWVIADTANLRDENSGNNALQNWTIKNTEAQQVVWWLELSGARKGFDQEFYFRMMGEATGRAEGSGPLLITEMNVFNDDLLVHRSFLSVDIVKQKVDSSQSYHCRRISLLCLGLTVPGIIRTGLPAWILPDSCVWITRIDHFCQMSCTLDLNRNLSNTASTEPNILLMRPDQKLQEESSLKLILSTFRSLFFILDSIGVALLD